MAAIFPGGDGLTKRFAKCVDEGVHCTLSFRELVYYGQVASSLIGLFITNYLTLWNSTILFDVLSFPDNYAVLLNVVSQQHVSLKRKYYVANFSSLAVPKTFGTAGKNVVKLTTFDSVAGSTGSLTKSWSNDISVSVGHNVDGLHLVTRA